MLARRMIRPDSKGRVTLGHLADGVSSFSITRDEANRIILEPYAEIPANEKWLFENKLALERVKQGLKDSAAGRFVERGSFAQYIDKDEDLEDGKCNLD